MMVLPCQWPHEPSGPIAKIGRLLRTVLWFPYPIAVSLAAAALRPSVPVQGVRGLPRHTVPGNTRSSALQSLPWFLWGGPGNLLLAARLFPWSLVAAPLAVRAQPFSCNSGSSDLANTREQDSDPPRQQKQRVSAPFPKKEKHRKRLWRPVAGVAAVSVCCPPPVSY